MSKLIVGLTGGIGSGKSAAAEYFARHGAAIVDADAVAHALTQADGKAMAAIRAEFGVSVLAKDGALDRDAMRRLAFADASVRKRLEAILHPLIRAECAALCRSAPNAYTLLVVPLLLESGHYRDKIDRLAVVDCSEALQIERVMARSRLTRDEVERIMATQVARVQRLAAADDIIDNSGTRAHLAAQIASLHAKYAEMARK